MIPELIYAFLLVLLSVISPCVVVMLPVVLSYIGSDSRKVLSFFAGHIIIFVILGVVAAITGKLLSQLIGRYLYLIAGAFTLLFGVTQFGVVTLPFPHVGNPKKGTSSFVLGLLFGLICLSCLGPLLAAVLVYVTSTGSVGAGALMMLSYGLGFSIPFVIFGFVITDKDVRKRLLKKEKVIKMISASLLISASLYLLYLGLRGL